MTARRIWRVVVTVTVLAFPNFAHAQRVHFGLTGGVHLSEINVSGLEALNVVLKPVFRPVGGLFVATDITESFILQPEVFWSRKGTRSVQPGVEGSVELTYIDATVLARYAGPSRSPVRVHVFTGPSLGVLLDANARSESEGRVEERDVKDDFESLDFGWVAGTGLEFGRHFLIDFRYTWGFTDIADAADVLPPDPEPPSNTGLKFRNRALTLTASVKF